MSGSGSKEVPPPSSSSSSKLPDYIPLTSKQNSDSSESESEYSNDLPTYISARFGPRPWPTYDEVVEHPKNSEPMYQESWEEEEDFNESPAVQSPPQPGSATSPTTVTTSPPSPLPGTSEASARNPTKDTSPSLPSTYTAERVLKTSVLDVGWSSMDLESSDDDESSGQSSCDSSDGEGPNFAYSKYDYV